MRFLLDASVPDDVAAAFVEAGHKVERVEADVLAAAVLAQAEPVTADRAVSEAATAADLPGRVLVFVQSPEPAGVTRLFARFKRLTPGRRYTVTSSKPKVGQLPNGLADRPA